MANTKITGNGILQRAERLDMICNVLVTRERKWSEANSDIFPLVYGYKVALKEVEDYLTRIERDIAKLRQESVLLQFHRSGEFKQIPEAADRNIATVAEFDEKLGEALRRVSDIPSDLRGLFDELGVLDSQVQ